MQYEKLFLDLLERVAVLEERVADLESANQELEEKEEFETVDGTPTRTISNRSMVLQEVTEILSNKYDFKVQKGKRADGGGLIVFKNGKKSNLKILVSRNYMMQPVEPEYEWGGWHTFVPSELELFDYYIFAIKISDDKAVQYFIFNNKTMSEICAQKEPDSNGSVYFYFRKRWNGKLVDARGEEADMSAFYNNWNIIQG